MTGTEHAHGVARLVRVEGTPSERAEIGRVARKRVPRSSHAGFAPAPGRRDPVDVLEEQAASRVPELVPIRYGRMVASEFAFFRGAAAIMAMDLAGTPDSGLVVQTCGDAHLANFGVYNSPDRRLVFDLNDFDETLPGPWEWDLKRLCASLVVAGRSNGFTDADNRRVVADAVRYYRTTMAEFAGMTNLQLWYARLEVDALLQTLRSSTSANYLRRLRRTSAKLASRDNVQAFAKLTEIVDGHPRFRAQPPLITPVSMLLGDVDATAWMHHQGRRIVDDYMSSLEDDRRHLVEQYRYQDLARKVVGVGSVGTRAWIALMLGRDGSDPLVLQLKEAQPSVLERYIGASAFDRHGHRVVAGQRLMQAASDIFLGWHRTIGFDGVERDFYVRQLRDGKGSVDLESFTPVGMRVYGEMCAWTLARAHARSGDRVALASYLGSGRVLDEALAEFAVAYADQNARDHAALAAAVDSGRVPATIGV